MCDVYVTPYLNEAQMTSGTLAYSFGLGKAVVSTPYWHAKELLADGRGILVPFGDAKAIGTEIAGLLTNDVRRHAMRKRAYAASRSMTWAQTAKRYLAVFEAASRDQPIRHRTAARTDRPAGGSSDATSRFRSVQTGHFLSLCDSTGMLQHAVHSVPDRAHGYCVDDNARALLFSCALASSRRAALARDAHRALCGIHPARLEPGHPAVPQLHELRPPMAGRVGLGRQSWPDALGIGANARATDTDPSRRRWAAALFKTALPVVESSRRRGPGPSRSWGWTPIARLEVGDISGQPHAQHCWPTG